MKTYFLIFLSLITLTGCTPKVYDPGVYEADDFKKHDYTLEVISVEGEEDSTVSLKYTNNEEFQSLGDFGEGTTLFLPLSSPLIEAFKVENATFSLTPTK